MKQRKFIFIPSILACFIAVLVGCSSSKNGLQPITEMKIYESYETADEQSEFYKEVSITIGKVDPTKSTAIVTVTMPDLEKYLQNGNSSEGDDQTVEIEFPVQQVNGTWQISSMEPLTDYIRSETTQILIEMMEDNGGITIDYDPQEVVDE